jgi:hypothetical protein
MARKIAIRAGGNPALNKAEPKRGRLRLFLSLVLAAGAASGVAALLANPLLFSVQTLAYDVHDHTSAQAINAKTLFPAVPPVHKTVDVYDPAPAAGPGKPPPDRTAPPETRPSPNPSPSHRPRHSPSPCPSTGCPDN